jgi:hypothetical protein
MVFRPLHKAASSSPVKSGEPIDNDGMLDLPVIEDVLLAPLEDSV